MYLACIKFRSCPATVTTHRLRHILSGVSWNLTPTLNLGISSLSYVRFYRLFGHLKNLFIGVCVCVFGNVYIQKRFLFTVSLKTSLPGGGTQPSRCGLLCTAKNFVTGIGHNWRGKNNVFRISSADGLYHYSLLRLYNRLLVYATSFRSNPRRGQVRWRRSAAPTKWFFKMIFYTK